MRKIFILLVLLVPNMVFAGLEVFAKASYSKSYVEADEWIQTLSASGGFAITLFTAIRLEARYANVTSLQNQLVYSNPQTNTNATLYSLKTEADVYSVGLNIDLLSERAPFQPYIYVGPGYIDKKQSFYVLNSAGQAVLMPVTEDKGITGNAGLGFRLRLARSIAVEVEAYAYGMDLDKKPQIDVSASAGVRVFF